MPKQPSSRRISFDKELVRTYAEQTIRAMKVDKRPLERAVAFQVYVAKMCNQIPIDAGDKFHAAVLKEIKKHGRVDKRSWHKQRA
jgi:diphthamide synthase subunit DPH2